MELSLFVGPGNGSGTADDLRAEDRKTFVPASVEVTGETTSHSNIMTCGGVVARALQSACALFYIEH